MIVEFQHRLKVLSLAQKPAEKKLTNRTQCRTYSRAAAEHFGSPVQEGCVPCMNVDCRWLEYLEIFYTQKLDFWSLPAASWPEAHCVICFRINNRLCRRSDIRIDVDRRVFVRGLLVLNLKENI
jgi:hypothetical protein